MKRVLAFLILAYASVSLAAEPNPPRRALPIGYTYVDPPAAPAPAPKKFKRGLKPTPKHKLFAIPRFIPKTLKGPASVTYVPKQLSMWLNDQDGDCVTAEEAFNQDVSGNFMQDATIQSWASKYGFLDGATLTDVMDQMAKSGFSQGGNTYSIGSYTSVNFSDEPTLQAALAIAPVKIGIDADALPSGAGNSMGWYATGGKVGQFTNEDHCVSLCGYGPASVLFAALGVPVPSGIDGTKVMYLLYTWKTIGVVDHDWIMSTVAEAYLRNPSASVNGNPLPNPGPNPGPNPPNPPTPSAGFTGSIVVTTPYVDGVAGAPVTVVGTGAGGTAAAVQADLVGAGVNPLVIVDVLKLLADIKAKAGLAVVAQDVLQIVADLTAAEPKK